MELSHIHLAVWYIIYWINYLNTLFIIGICAVATVNFCLPFFLDTVSFLFLSRAKLAACYLVFAFPRLSLLPQKERYFLLINLSIKVDTKMTQWGKMFFWNRILIFLHIDNFMKYVLKHSNICAMIKVRGRYISWNCSRIIIKIWFQK